MNTFQEKCNAAVSICKQLLSTPKVLFREMKPSSIPEVPGVYAIFNQNTGVCLYVGRTKNLRQRLYNNHLMGPTSNARLKKYLIDDPGEEKIVDLPSAKQYLREECYVQYLPVEDMLTRGQIEGMLGFFLDVHYLYEEH
ncbi:GIY-YIG nuclease family protein [Candidatus Avoscillospira sp. LCP25S3_F1]|uniref:GIY-YIG nuclease family protein n=1 Tax=Candidatus Avoscillospira sp. LCP25S3_F1 TaxID=3438825 RepID=UPI003F926880